MAGILEQLVLNLNQIGFYGFVLPFLLVFGLVFGLLARTKLLGESKGPAGIVSLAIAFFVTAYSGIGQYFIALSGIGGMLLGALLIVVLFFVMLGFQMPSDQKPLEFFTSGWFLASLAVLGVILFLVLQGATMTSISLSPEAMAAIFVVIVVVLAMWFVTRPEKTNKPPK